MRVAGRKVSRRLARWMMGIREDTCWDEHSVLHVGDESLNSTDINTTLYVN